MLPIAILAGGLATRLRPITEKIPKALISVSGEPFIFHQLRYLKLQGISKVVICVGYLGGQIESLIGAGEQFDLNISYSYDGEKLLGTGGAIKSALSKLGDEFFIIYGDSYLPIDFKEVQQAYKSSGMPALMTVIRNLNQWDRSNASYKDGVVVEYSKKNINKSMQFIDYGLSIVSAKVFDCIGGGEKCDLAKIFEKMSFDGLLAGKKVLQRFYEIGTLSGLKDTSDYFSALRRSYEKQ